VKEVLEHICLSFDYLLIVNTKLGRPWNTAQDRRSTVESDRSNS
jgi:hypothetical protein